MCAREDGELFSWNQRRIVDSIERAWVAAVGTAQLAKVQIECRICSTRGSSRVYLTLYLGLMSFKSALAD